MHKALFHPRSTKFLEKISKKEATAVISKIKELCKDPSSETLDTRKMTHTKNMHRLRIGKIRVLYEIDHVKKFLYIHNIDFRGNVYS